MNWFKYNFIPSPLKPMKIKGGYPKYSKRLLNKPLLTIRLLSFKGRGISVVNWFGLIEFKYYSFDKNYK